MWFVQLVISEPLYPPSIVLFYTVALGLVAGAAAYLALRRMRKRVAI